MNRPDDPWHRHECYAITEEGAGSDVDAIAPRPAGTAMPTC